MSGRTDDLAQRPGATGWMVGGVPADAYDAAFEARAQRGVDVHGEARFVERFHPRSVLDAGCGTGRVGRELARHAIDVVGVDIDPGMLDIARRKSPEVDWRLGDLSTVSLGRTFDVVVLAGNVMIFLASGAEAPVVRNLAIHLHPGGILVAGFQLGFSLTLDRYDELAYAAGLQLAERWATWDLTPWEEGSAYAVSVHRRPQSTTASLEREEF